MLNLIRLATGKKFGLHFAFGKHIARFKTTYPAPTQSRDNPLLVAIAIGHFLQVG